KKRALQVFSTKTDTWHAHLSVLSPADQRRLNDDLRTVLLALEGPAQPALQPLRIDLSVRNVSPAANRGDLQTGNWSTSITRSRAGYAWATALVSWLLPAGGPGAEVGRDRAGSGARQCATPSMTAVSSRS